MLIDENSRTVMTQEGETIDQLKETMFLLMKKKNDIVYGLFNGQPYICTVDCEDKSKISMF